MAIIHSVSPQTFKSLVTGTLYLATSYLAQMRRQMPVCLEYAMLGYFIWMFLCALSMKHCKCFLFSGLLSPPGQQGLLYLLVPQAPC